MIRFLLPLVALGWWPFSSQAQFQPLPKLSINRRADGAYMDSLAQLAKRQYHALSKMPHTVQHDTLRFQALYYLGGLYKWWYSRRDSTLHFSNELINQARQSRNIYFIVNGKLLQEEYYRNGALNTPQALRLNFEMLSLLPKTNLYDGLRYRINMNLGDLYSITKDYTNALHYLDQAHQLLLHGLPNVGANGITALRGAIEQHIGAVYKQQDNFVESEKHYVAAEKLLGDYASESSRAFVYDDLGELYLKYKRYEQALHYAKKAEAIWDHIKTPAESHSWGTLACVYAGLGQDEQAVHYAQQVLGLPQPNKFIREQAYMALYQVAEHQKDWKNLALHYKKYIVVRDSIAESQHSLELVSIEKQAEYDRLALQSQQQQQLQAQRLLTLQKQAELDRVRASAEADAFARKTRLSEQQRLLDNERAKTLLNRQQTAQRFQQQAFEQQALKQENRFQQNFILFSTSSSLLLLGVLILLLFLVRLRKRKAEADLRLAEERKEVDARIIHTQEAERRRLAADLHDDLGGTLATLRRRLDDIRLHLHEPEAAQAFDALQPLIQKSSDDLRRIAHNLMPPEFSRIGLLHTIRQLVQSQPAQPTRFSFITSGPEQKLPLETELNAYRIVSELLQNISKHAQANQAAVQLLYYDDRLTITVEDDGLGSQSASSEYGHTGIGLKNTNLRAEYIGATLWRDVSEAGTLVVLNIPYSTSVYAPRITQSAPPD
nr:histidine kinase [Spirosoma validum]